MSERALPSFRRLAVDFLTYGSADVLLRALALITLPIYTRALSPGEYGAWSLILTGVAFFGAILALGGDSAYARYYFEARTTEERRTLTSTWLGFLSLWSLGITLAVLPLAGALSSAGFGSKLRAGAIALALLSAPVALISAICGQVLRNGMRARAFAVLNVATTILMVGFGLIGLLVFDLGVSGVIGGALLGGVVMLPVRLWSVRAMLGAHLSGDLLRKLLAYGLPLVPTSVAYWVISSADRLFLARLASLRDVGLYSVANGAVSILMLGVGALGQAWGPHALEAHESNRDEAPAFYGRTLTVILAVFGVAAVTLTTFSPQILRLLSTRAYAGAAVAIGPLALGAVAYASTQVTGLGISLTKRTRWLAYASWGAAIVNLALNLVLIPTWGMTGAAVATALTYVGLTLVYAIVAHRLYPIRYQGVRSGLVIVATLGFVLAAPALPEPVGIAGFGPKLLFCLAYAGIVVAAARTSDN